MAGKRKSKFNPEILNEIDKNGDFISTWCRPGYKPEEAICVICDTVINCSQHGVTAIKRHALLNKHIDKCSKYRDATGLLKKKGQQLKLIDSFSTSASLSHHDKVSSSEAKFAVTVAVNDISYRTGHALSNQFIDLFDDSKIARDFSCGRNKLSYLISDGLGPYFKNQILNEIFKTQSFFSIQIDETPIPEKRVQQLDVLIRYFSESQKQVVCEHLQSFHLGSATSEILLKHINEALSVLPQDKFLSFFSDGPNVMKSLYMKLQNSHPFLLNIGTCSLHKLHNAFACGLDVFLDLEEFCIDVYYFFKHSAVRSEEFKEKQLHLGLPDHIFLRHVPSRWLTLQLALERVIEQYEAIKKYFMSNCKNVRAENNRYVRILKILKCPSSYPKLLFLKNAAELFTPFQKVFQQEGPLVHILYDEMFELVKKILGRFLIAEFVNSLSSGSDIKKVDPEKNWLKKPEVGLDTERALCDLSETEKKDIYMSARQFYKKCAAKLINTLPIDNHVLKSLKCLHPLSRTEKFSVRAIKHLASQVPNVIETSAVSSLADEWLCLQSENVDTATFLKKPNETTDVSDDEDNFLSESNFVRLDTYWTYIFNIKNHIGKAKYPLLSKIVKSLLCLPHGNAEVERGFSENKRVMNNRSQLSLPSLNGLRLTKSYMKRFGSDSKTLPVTHEFLKCIKQSSKNYRQRIECEAAQKLTKRVNEDSEENLQQKELRIKQQLDAAQKMLGNAEELLASGISLKDFSKVESAQAILQDSKKKIELYINQLKMVRNEMDKYNDVKRKKK